MVFPDSFVASYREKQSHPANGLVHPGAQLGQTPIRGPLLSGVWCVYPANRHKSPEQLIFFDSFPQWSIAYYKKFQISSFV